jgi:MauM/NapG family ferredoxin protein
MTEATGRIARLGSPASRTAWARRSVQAAFLLLFLFLFLQTEQKGADELGYPVKLFLDFDPLLFLSTLLSSHAVAASALWLSLIVLGVTAVFGRVFCGWVCPLGTLNNLVGAMKRWRLGDPVRGWHPVKYYLLVALLVASLFSVQVAGVLDPLSLTVRSFSLGVYPAVNKGLNSGVDALYGMNSKGVTAVADVVAKVLQKTILAFTQPHFFQGAAIGLLFLAILLLNLVEKRFWCRYLCPLGALLGVAARWAPFKREAAESCNACSLCGKDCQGAARPGGKGEWLASECFYCFNCDDPCPKGAVTFRFSPKPAPSSVDLSRRRLMVSALAGAAAVPLLRAQPHFRPGFTRPDLIRPPGALPEPEFLDRCVKCGECMKVCTTNGLQPTLWEAGLEGIWSPVLVPRIGYCEFNCTLCGQVCPTGAIRRLSLPEKQKTRIGTAMIDKGRCLPYAHSTPCIVCEEVCPTPKKAIWFEPTTVHNRNGDPVDVKQPRVDLDLCIGCGICETKCPVLGRPAIYVMSVGESRSKENQLLLQQTSGPYG